MATNCPAKVSRCRQQWRSLRTGTTRTARALGTKASGRLEPQGRPASPSRAALDRQMKRLGAATNSRSVIATKKKNVPRIKIRQRMIIMTKYLTLILITTEIIATKTKKLLIYYLVLKIYEIITTKMNKALFYQLVAAHLLTPVSYTHLTLPTTPYV